MTVELEVSEEVVERLVDEMKNEAQRMENVLQSFRSNSLTDMHSYENVLEERETLLVEIEELEEQIGEESDDGLAELFS